MNRHQIMQNLFGDQSEEEEVASSHEMNHQPNFNSNEKDGGSELENKSISKQGIKIESGAELNDEARSSRSRDGGSELENKSISQRGVELQSGAELNDEARSSRSCDGGSELENKSISKKGVVKIESGAELNDEARSSRLTRAVKDEDQVLLSAVIRDVFGDSDDDEPAEYGVQDGTDQGGNDCRSTEHKVNYEKELKSEGIVSDEDTPYVSEEEKAESVCRLLVLEIPQRTLLADPSQMATIELSNIIGIDPKPFDPTTYVEEDFYVTDSSGSERLIPPTNIIRWRNVINSDGTTSVESNARFVTWSDGSLQLLIGNEAFDVSEEDAEEIQSHIFLWNAEGTYQAQGRISKTMKVEPSSLSSDSHCLSTALVDSEDKKVHKVGHYIAHVDPERVAEQPWQAEQKTTEDNEWPNQTKKDNRKQVNRKCNSKDSKEHHVSSSNVEDVIDEEPRKKSRSQERPRSIISGPIQ